MNSRIKKVLVALAVGLGAGLAFAAASSDQLKDTVIVGLGVASNKTITFNIGSGSANPLIKASSGGTLSFTSDGTHFLSVPTLTGTAATLAGIEALTNKTLNSTDTLTGAKMASFTPDGTHTLTLPTVTGTLMQNPLTTSGDIIYAVGAVPTRLPAGSSFTLLHGNGGSAPTWTGLDNADVNSNAAIVYSKLSLTGGIVNADINGAAAIAGSKLAAANTSTTGTVSYETSGTSTLTMASGPRATNLSTSIGFARAGKVATLWLGRNVGTTCNSATVFLANAGALPSSITSGMSAHAKPG